MCIIASFYGGLQTPPTSLATIAESGQWDQTSFLGCLMPTVVIDAFITATAQISSSGRQQVHPVQDTELGSLQATSLFPPCLNWQWADIFLIEVPSDRSSMCAGTFGGWTLQEVMRMLRRADAHACTEHSSVWSLTLLPLFCLSFLYPLPKD